MEPHLPKRRPSLLRVPTPRNPKPGCPCPHNRTHVRHDAKLHTDTAHAAHTHTHARTHARTHAQIKHTHHADARTHHTRARTALQRVSMSTDVTAATWLEHSSGVMAVHALGTFSHASPCLILSQNRAGRLLTRLLRHPPLRTQGKEKARDRTQGQQKSVVSQFSGACGGRRCVLGARVKRQSGQR